MIELDDNSFIHENAVCFHPEGGTPSLAMCMPTTVGELPFCYDRGNSFLHMAAQFASDPALIEFLVQEGEDVKGVNEDGASVGDYAKLNINNSEIHATVVGLQQGGREISDDEITLMQVFDHSVPREEV